VDFRTSPIPDRLSAALADRYLLSRELGAGGMATVYLAEDLRHHRRVAVKVLKPELAAVIGAERFLAEIRTTANLQHPHILPLFDSGEADHFLFYVMPYVEGESLRDRLQRETQLPIADAVRIAGEVAAALDYAHRHGVVHRDIKPENILLHDGQALVADFGIALALTSAGTGSGSRMTETGMSLGTPHYMSPEQAMGERDIGARSDVYALGAVTYEMLVGEPPFTGPSVQAIVARVLTEPPRPLLPQRHTIPPHIEAAVLTALEKLPADRYLTAGDFLAALGNTSLARAATATVAMRSAAPASGWRARSALPLAALALLLAGVLAWRTLRPAPVEPLQRYALALPDSEAVTGMFGISPDGLRLVYAGPGGRLWLKAPDRVDPVPLPPTEGAQQFTFSPDGQSIAFVQAGHLMRMPLGGNSAIQLADSASITAGLAWLDDGSIIYVRPLGRALMRVPAAGGRSELLFQSDSLPALLPRPLPGSRHFLFTVCRGGTCGNRQDLAVFDVRTRQVRVILPAVAAGDYLEPGRLILVRRDGVMLAVPFDARRATVTGQPVPVRDSISMLLGVVPLYSVSRTGTLVARLGISQAAERYTLVSVDRTGREATLDSSWTFQSVVYGANAGWSVSPDGRKLAIGLSTGAGDDIWIKKLPDGTLSRLSLDSASEFRPRWLPDGLSVMFASTRGAPFGGQTGVRLFTRAADGTGADSLVLDLGRTIFEAALTPDLRWMALRLGGVINQVGGRDIYAIRPGVDSVPVPLMASTVYDESDIALSPDGHWIAYQSDETGNQEVYLRPFPQVDGGKQQVSNRGGHAPLWARNGKELYYVNDSRDMMAVEVGAGAALGTARLLFRLDPLLYLTPTENYTPYDITPDGRFIMARQVRRMEPLRPVVVTEHWFPELEMRMRGGR
jgi:serine/threonine-protein kinase